MKKKIFLDCGSNECQGFTQFVKMQKITSDSEVHCFEPNPYCNIDEFKLRSIANNLGVFPNVRFHRSAIFDDGVCSIVVSKDISKRNGEGTAVHNMGNVNTINHLQLQGVELIVASTNLSSFVSKLDLKDEDELRIKLDIEGSEFFVLDDFLKNFNQWNSLKEIWVEWHERYMRGFDPYALRFNIEKRFLEKGVHIIEWH